MDKNHPFRIITQFDREDYKDKFYSLYNQIHNPEGLNTKSRLVNRWLQQYLVESWFVTMQDHQSFKPLSPILHHLSQYYPYRDHCQKFHPELDLESCAIAFTFFKDQGAFEEIHGKSVVKYFGYSDIYLSDAMEGLLRTGSRYFAHVGLLFYLLGIQVNQKVMV